jgi:hypothetical protein
LIKPVPLALAALALVAAGPVTLSPADQSAAFSAAGFKRVGGQWKACDDPAPSSTAGAVQETADLNGDGRPEVILTEGSSNCYGSTEAGYFLVSKQTNGTWKLIDSGPGVITVLATRGVGGWPDLEIGGPGFCFPVERWNGNAYKVQRHQYEGKACRP